MFTAKLLSIKFQEDASLGYSSILKLALHTKTAETPHLVWVAARSGLYKPVLMMAIRH